MSDKPNFIEVQTVNEANMIDLDVYCFVRLSDQRGYVFKKRSIKK